MSSIRAVAWSRLRRDRIRWGDRSSGCNDAGGRDDRWSCSTTFGCALTARPGRSDILRGISLAIMPGETVALVGPSGSGKSSLMMVVAGIERPSAGQVVVAGQDLASLDESGLARLRRHHIGIVFQSFHLLPTMTARENVAVPLELAGRRDAFALAEAALATGRARASAGALSGAAVGRRAAARRDRARLCRRPGAAAGRRADRQSRPRDRRGGHRLSVRASTPGSARRCC